MTHSIIWLHDEALRLSHPVFSAAPTSADVVFTWDEVYFKHLNYSLKRLVFIYETLCTLPIEIIYGDTLIKLRELSVSSIYVPYSNSLFVQHFVRELSGMTKVEVIDNMLFVQVHNTKDYRRFFSYWKEAEKLAFLINGGIDA